MTYLTVLIVAFVGTLVATPLARRLAGRLGALDFPKELGIHSKPVPRTGGIAIYLGWLVAAITGGFATGSAEGLRPQFLGVILAGSAVHFIGLLDDMRSLSPLARLIGQIGAGVALLVSGIAVLAALPFWLSVPASLLWFIGLMNAVNLLDGMDGLAAGVAAVGALAFAALAAMQGNFLALVLSAALLGSSLAFLRCNMHPAAMFMGDGGSLFLGLQLSVLGALLTREQGAAGWLVAPALVLSLPLLDTAGAIVRRLRARRSLFTGDRRHIYDLLLARGVSQPQTVGAMWFLSALAALCALALAQQASGVLSAAGFVGFVIIAAIGAARLGLFSLDT